MSYNETMYSKILTHASRVKANNPTLCDSCNPTIVTDDCNSCPVCTLSDTPSTFCSCTRVGMLKRVIM